MCDSTNIDITLSQYDYIAKLYLCVGDLNTTMINYHNQ